MVNDVRTNKDGAQLPHPQTLGVKPGNQAQGVQAQGVQAQGVQAQGRVQPQNQVKPEVKKEQGAKAPLTVALFETALKYNGVEFKTEKEDNDILLLWSKGEGDDKISYKVVVAQDSSFTTFVEKGNTVHKVSFNNTQESQNVFAKAIDLINKGNVVE